MITRSMLSESGIRSWRQPVDALAASTLGSKWCIRLPDRTVGRDFVDMARGKHTVSNTELVGFGQMETVFVDVLERKYLESEPEDESDEDGQLVEAPEHFR
jgi:hypothetical protein